MPTVVKIQFDELFKFPPNGAEPKNNSVITDHCRKLIKDGYPPETRLEVYRTRAEPDVIVKNIGEGAKITCRENENEDPHFVKYVPLPERFKKVGGIVIV